MRRSALERKSSERLQGDGEDCYTMHHRWPDTINSVSSYSVRARYAIYEALLSVRPLSQISMPRLRLDLQYPRFLFSSCSRRRGKKRRHNTWLLAAPSFQPRRRRSSSSFFSERAHTLRPVRGVFACPQHPL